MKKLIALLMIGTLAISCGNDPQKETEKKVKKLEKLKAEYAEKGKEIAELEAELAGKIDTTKNLPPVKAHALEPMTFKRPVDVQGMVESDQNILINSEVPANVLEVAVKEGQSVSKGQLLVRLNGDVTANSIAEVETAYELAQTTYERTEKLYKQNVGTEIQLLQAKNRRDALQKQLATLRTQYAKYTITSPISGIVDAVNVKTGESVLPGLPIIRVVDNSNLKVKAEVSERYVKAIKTGDSVMIKFPDMGEEIGAKVSAVGQVISTGNRTFSIIVNLPKNSLNLKPNLLSMVSFNDIVVPGAIAVPSNTIINDSRESFVYVIENKGGKNMVKKVTVVTGESGNGYTLIKEGLKAGDMLVYENMRNINDGDEVTIVKQ